MNYSYSFCVSTAVLIYLTSISNAGPLKDGTGNKTSNPKDCTKAKPLTYDLAYNVGEDGEYLVCVIKYDQQCVNTMRRHMKVIQWKVNGRTVPAVSEEQCTDSCNFYQSKVDTDDGAGFNLHVKTFANTQPKDTAECTVQWGPKKNQTYVSSVHIANPETGTLWRAVAEMMNSMKNEA